MGLHLATCRFLLNSLLDSFDYLSSFRTRLSSCLASQFPSAISLSQRTISSTRISTTPPLPTSRSSPKHLTALPSMSRGNLPTMDLFQARLKGNTPIRLLASRLQTHGPPPTA